MGRLAHLQLLDFRWPPVQLDNGLHALRDGVKGSKNAGESSYNLCHSEYIPSENFELMIISSARETERYT